MSAMTPTNLDAARVTYRNIAANISKVMRGQDAATWQLLAALAAGSLERETLTREAKFCLEALSQRERRSATRG